MTKSAYLILLAAACLSITVDAQDKPAASKKATDNSAMAMPKPGPEMKELRGMIGSWVSDEQYEVSPMMPAGGTGSGTSTAKLGPGGFSVLLEVHSKNGMGAFSGHCIFAWDANEKAYKSAWVDSMTPGLLVETGHKEGDNLVFTGATQMQGKKLSLKDVYSDRMPGSMTLTSYMNDGSGEKKVMTIKLTKQDSAAAKK